MSHDVECPYCGAGINICHDDGQGYEEDVRHEGHCRACDKYFVFTTSIHFSYEAAKADCLNESEHRLKFQRTYPDQFSYMICEDCDYETRKHPEIDALLKTLAAAGTTEGGSK